MKTHAHTHPRIPYGIIELSRGYTVQRLLRLGQWHSKLQCLPAVFWCSVRSATHFKRFEIWAAMLGPDGFLIGQFLVNGCEITGATRMSSGSHCVSLCLLLYLLNRCYIICRPVTLCSHHTFLILRMHSLLFRDTNKFEFWPNSTHGNSEWYWVVRIREAKSTTVYETALVEMHQ